MVELNELDRKGGVDSRLTSKQEAAREALEFYIENMISIGQARGGSSVRIRPGLLDQIEEFGGLSLSEINQIIIACQNDGWKVVPKAGRVFYFSKKRNNSQQK